MDLGLRIGERTAQVNYQPRELQLAPYIKNGRTMVPLQFLADVLDLTLTINPDSGQIVISSNSI